MMEAVCDRCGKRIILEHSGLGLTYPDGWRIVTQNFPTRRETLYRILCPDCDPRRVKE